MALVIAVLISSRSYRVAIDGSVAAAAGAPVTGTATQAAALIQPSATAGPTQAFEPPTQAPSVIEPTATGDAEGPHSPPVMLATPQPTNQPPILYYTQAGDTIQVVAARFGVAAEEITSPDPIPPETLFNPGQLLIVPHALGETTNDRAILPDSEVVYSPTAVDLDIDAFVREAGGYLATYREYLGSTGWTTGAQIIKRIALENSINPRLLLALLELRAHWVYGQPTNLAEENYPLGMLDRREKDLLPQLSWAVSKLSVGYYSWREGRLTDLVFPDGTTRRIAPNLNAGSVALQYLMAQVENEREWGGLLYSPEGLTALYERMFGSPWLRAQKVEPLFPATLSQPVLHLPFYKGQMWSYSGGPHSAWIPEPEGGRAALDFAPGSTESGCVKSEMWVVAAASGLVTRSDHGVVVLDLDGDGHEQTGWVILYLHIATDGRVGLGEWVDAGYPIGHPSCEGGNATGTHVHVARKYNGEWIAADGPLPFVMSGYRPHAGVKPYEGTLTKGTVTVTACTCGSFETQVRRPLTEP